MKSPFIVIIILFATLVTITIGIHQIASAQQQPPQTNLTTTEKKYLQDGISFQIENVTFSHHTATVNGIK